MKEQIEITHFDFTRLNGIINSVKQYKKKELEDILYLETELNRAKKIDSKKIGPDYVTMNSVVEIIDLDTNRTMEIKLVYPGDADFKKGNISILSPLGSALIGYKTGAEVSFKVPRGVKRIRISRILYQPEASGEYTT